MRAWRTRSRILLVLVAFLTVSAAHARDLIDTVASDGSFMTLVNALKAAGLAAALKGAGPWTVFAPTDEAFAKLPRDTFDSLLQWENRDRLAALVRKHVVPGRVVTSAIAGQRLSIATVGDDNIYIDAVSGMTVDGAAVTRPDIEATNGIIHVIDRVILPQS